jgi:hypothetical protein
MHCRHTCMTAPHDTTRCHRQGNCQHHCCLTPTRRRAAKPTKRRACLPCPWLQAAAPADLRRAGAGHQQGGATATGLRLRQRRQRQQLQGRGAVVSVTQGPGGRQGRRPSGHPQPRANSTPQPSDCCLEVAGVSAVGDSAFNPSAGCLDTHSTCAGRRLPEGVGWQQRTSSGIRRVVALACAPTVGGASDAALSGADARSVAARVALA